MRFKFKDKPIVYCGDRKIITKFLWLPLTLDKELRWLETARIQVIAINESDWPVSNGSRLIAYKWVYEKWAGE
jgi:hypothetical protein